MTRSTLTIAWMALGTATAAAFNLGGIQAAVLTGSVLVLFGVIMHEVCTILKVGIVLKGK